MAELRCEASYPMIMIWIIMMIWIDSDGFPWSTQRLSRATHHHSHSQVALFASALHRAFQTTCPAVRVTWCGSPLRP